MQTKDFDTLVREQVTAIQGGSSSLVDLTVGSILRSVVEAYAMLVMWLQSLILQAVALTRAATSSGSDLDSWVADYGQTRNAAVNAVGYVTFARFTPTAQATIPAGSVVQTADGTQTFVTQAEAFIAAGITSVQVQVKAATAGAGANVTIGSINKLGQAISGVDTVTNGATFTNGSDAESDEALRSRFVAYIASLSKATKDAVGYAATNAGMKYTLVENQTYAGVAQMGYFYLVVDDGTGTPSPTLLSTVYNAIDAVRPVTSTFGVFAPVKVNAEVSMTITTAAGYDHAAEAALVSAAVTDYINSLSLGASLAYTRLAQVAYGASDGVTNVSSVLLNGSASDLAATSQQVIKATTVSVA